ncbi:hypothetical protein EE612_003448 [Oryza sativa]|nr:hypothetical protein EE612_003448 [Oryza sativa]
MAPLPAAGAAGRIILAHGACHGGWCWYKVAALLRAAGHRVDAPDLGAAGGWAWAARRRRRSRTTRARCSTPSARSPTASAPCWWATASAA